MRKYGTNEGTKIWALHRASKHEGHTRDVLRS